MTANTGNAYPTNTPKYSIEDVIDFLENLYDVVFMTYESNITAYGMSSRVLIVVPHDIDWVKERVRWYWDNKLMKHRKPTSETAVDSKSAKTEGESASRQSTVIAT